MHFPDSKKLPEFPRADLYQVRGDPDDGLGMSGLVELDQLLLVLPLIEIVEESELLGDFKVVFLDGGKVADMHQRLDPAMESETVIRHDRLIAAAGLRAPWTPLTHTEVPIVVTQYIR